TATSTGCSQTTSSVTVNATPVISNINTTTCSETIFTVTPDTNTNTIPAGTTYSWLSPAGSGFTGSTIGNNSVNISNTLKNTTTGVSTAIYSVSPLAGTCMGNSFNVVVTLNPNATVSTLTPNQIICNDSSTALNFSSNATGGSIVYNWKNNNVSIGLGGSNSGNISFAVKNTTTAPLIADITVTPSFTNGGKTCIGTANVFHITANPTAKISPHILDQLVCDNSTQSKISFNTSSTGGSVLYNWTNNKTSIGLGSNAINTTNILPFTAINTGTKPDTAKIKVTPYFVNSNSINGLPVCQGTVDSFNIIVNPRPITPVFTVSPGNTLCNNTLNQNFSVKSDTKSVVFDWYSSANGRIVSQYRSTPPTNVPDGSNAIISFYNGLTDTITVKATDTTSKCYKSLTSVIYLNAPAIDSAGVIYNGSDFVCLLNTPNTYLWGFDNLDLKGTSIPAEVEQNYFLPSPEFTKKYYWVTTTDASGCFTKNYYTAPGLYSSDGLIAGPPLDTLAINSIKLIPNPAKANVTILWNNGLWKDHIILTIRDVNGRLVISRKFDDTYTIGQTNVNVSNLPAGMYFVSILQNGKIKATTKLVKE
ncbi:MAG TPA: T9SS type A sorting domain-containing protein, partial [Panacibacter sp.]|nr:T9SS type A sorting domain-containing protein [Panacibacter sp.]